MNPKKVLLVDDDLSVIASYIEILRAMNLDCIPLVSTSYQMMKKMLLSENVDIMLLDLMLPDVVVTDILPEVRRENPDIPIVLVTAFPEDLDRDKAQQARIAALIPKPFRLESMCQIIESVLQGRVCLPLPA